MHYHYGPSSSIPSSPPPSTRSSSRALFLSPTRTVCSKEKRNPSVTPRRFGRFFTPRSNMSAITRRPLASLSSALANRQPISPESLQKDTLGSDLDTTCSSPTDRLQSLQNEDNRSRPPEEHRQSLKRRRGMLEDDILLPELKLPVGIPLNGTEVHAPLQGDVRGIKTSADTLSDRRKATLNLFFKASRGYSRNLGEKPLTSVEDLIPIERATYHDLKGYRPTPIRKFRNRGFESQMLSREHGFSSSSGQHYLAMPACDPRVETASYYSRSCDTHTCSAYSGQGNTIPFSLASCHKAPVTVIGDEQGYVRFFNTTTTESFVDTKVDLHMKIHDNAIMDLALSDDDLRLATACGDRTGKILDVVTQSVAVELGGGHHDSLRQITFQPGIGNGNALATSDRAGRIQIWDLRCSSIPTGSFSVRGPQGVTQREERMEPFHVRTVNTIDYAHQRKLQGTTSSASITAIHWLPTGREHLLLSACEANATIKLWDTRYIKPRRQVEETPLAATPEPRSHAWRSYGITSLAISSDAARLYAVCKDSTVYAYSTEHLILGNAPGLERGAVKRKPHAEQGLGPLYGFKHESFRAQSFYVKCAIRPSTGTSPELLAVGSSNSCAVLFPTDERYLRSSWDQRSHVLDQSSAATPAAGHAPPPTPSQSSSSPFFSFSCSTPSAANSGSGSTIPIYRAGTPLIRGHTREVTTLNWSYDGKLVSASDDYMVRQWQKDDAAARHLRHVGEFGGERHMAGWADVSNDWDTADDEE